MFKAPEFPYLVPFDGSFQIEEASRQPPKGAPKKSEAKDLLNDLVDDLSELQRKLYAHDRYSILTVFQAMDAAGKDSTIRAVLSGVNPAGCEVYSFKQPSALALDHDFMWRNWIRLPERGRIGVFNRSYYEEVLIVRVHPHILEAQKIPDTLNSKNIWDERYQSIRDLELHLARNGTIILKFFLHVSQEEQLERFISRLEEPEKNWKFADSDISERALWPKYMEAYQDALNATSKPWAPWYCVPADNKPYMRYKVAEILVKSLESLNLSYPSVDKERRNELEKIKEELLDQREK